MQELLIQIAISVATGVIGAIGGGWWMVRRKTATLRSQLASSEWENVGDIVDSYIRRIGSMSDEITQLHGDLVTIRGQVAELKVLNQQLIEENRTIKQENEHLKANQQ